MIVRELRLELAELAERCEAEVNRLEGGVRCLDSGEVADLLRETALGLRRLATKTNT